MLQDDRKVENLSFPSPDAACRGPYAFIPQYLAVYIAGRGVVAVWRTRIAMIGLSSA